MVKLLNRAKMSISSTGTGDITLAAAVVNFQTFAQAGAVDGNVVRYGIEDGAAWEVGTAVMSNSATVMARTVNESSAGGNALNLTSSAVVFCTLSAADFSDNAAPSFVNTIPSALELNSGAVSTIDGKALDDDGFPVTYSFDAHNGTTVYSASSLPPQFSAVSINQSTGVFSMTASTNAATGAGNVNFRVRASDGVRTATRTTVCSLSFLPTSGLTGLYDMKDSNSYSGSGSTWADVSGNSGPNLTIDTSKVTYNSSGTGGIPSLSLDTNTATAAVSAGSGTSGHAGLTNASSPYSNTVVMIYSRPSSNNQSWGYFMSSTSQGHALIFESSSSAAITSGTAQSGSWPHNAAQSTSKLYIDKVDQSSMTQQQFKDFLLDSNNDDKYHSIALTDGLFYYGWATSIIHPNLGTACLKGELRALVFYNRALSQSELTGLHAHFAADYTSSTMVQ